MEITGGNSGFPLKEGLTLELTTSWAWKGRCLGPEPTQLEEGLNVTKKTICHLLYALTCLFEVLNTGWG